MKFTIITNYTSSHSISLHSADLEKLSISELQVINVKVGAIGKNAVTLLKHQGEESVIHISADLLSGFSLPDFIEYEVTIDEEALLIGPIIGLFILGKFDEMTEQRMRIYKKYLLEYQHINGLILLVTSDGIDEENKIVNGFSYNPIEKEWMKGTFPFPSVMYCRKTVKKAERMILENLIGNKYFNSHVFNKWEMWQWLSTNDELSGYLPETGLAVNLQEVKKLVDENGCIFLKPISGMKGMGIYQLVKGEQEYKLNYRLSGLNMITVLDNWDAVEYYMGTELNLKKYIFQKGIPLLKYDDRVIDFRAIVIKDQHGSWAVPGMVTKYGEKESIVSNISSGGSAEKSWKTLSEIYGGDFKEAYKKYKEMEQISILCCRLLEKRGIHLAYIGIDIGMDKDKNLWIIEINNRTPDMTIALDANDFQLYYHAKAAPLHYSKWVAGFRGELK
ncbi:YheC/YheD family protein [Bacillus sp. FJAT-29790]|uniref:YheC/YheD family endospore coat-associated protein n=1 Tax=Bacillus sp. FJAT-29790 TaxID=1895002 RepID=UPI001C249929|nr:YheC/YheD family protein [Bacillus sp. FJAT-29790]MBU8879971.1 YheC/YheD family protein [Bacillus sp. FJAT-29790]